MNTVSDVSAVSAATAGLSIADVSFAYAAGETTLRRVSLEVPEGTFLTDRKSVV